MLEKNTRHRFFRFYLSTPPSVAFVSASWSPNALHPVIVPSPSHPARTGIPTS